jgi:hypothetical protein
LQPHVNNGVATKSLLKSLPSKPFHAFSVLMTGTPMLSTKKIWPVPILVVSRSGRSSTVATEKDMPVFALLVSAARTVKSIGWLLESRLSIQVCISDGVGIFMFP